MFAPAIGISEDPVTGNAHGPRGAYLVHHNLVECGSTYRFVGQQGEAISRTGQVEVLVHRYPSLRVQISGRAVEVFNTKLRVD